MVDPQETYFNIDARILFQLGEQLVTDRAVALAELIKNAYDADASIVNGVMEKIAEEELTIAQLLKIRNVESPEMVSVQCNGKIVDRTCYENTPVSGNDEVEFLYFMGGGSKR